MTARIVVRAMEGFIAWQSVARCVELYVPGRDSVAPGPLSSLAPTQERKLEFVLRQCQLWAAVSGATETG